MNLVRKSRSRQHQVATQKMSESMFPWTTKSRFLQMIEQRFKDTTFKPILIGEVFGNWVELSSLSEVRLIVLLQEMNNFDEINSSFMKNNLEIRQAHMISFNEMEELKRFQGSTFDTIARRRLRRSRHQPWTHRQDSGSAERNDLPEWFERCWISTQWKVPRYQSTCVFPTSSNSWWNAKPSYRNAEPQRRAANHLGHTWCIGKRFCKSRCVLYSTLSAGIESMEFRNIRTDSLNNDGEQWKSNTS